jgi:4-aminobutyrate aminotransferase-like enzyme
MANNVFDSFLNDPNYLSLKSQLMELYSHYSQKLTDIKPPNRGKEARYQQLLNKMGDLRGGQLWYPYLGSGMGNGAFVELWDGSVKLDFISGIGAHWSHGHPEVIDARLDSSFSDLVLQGNLQQNISSYECLTLFKELSGMDHVFLTTSGAMAAENALKMAFQKNHPAHRVLAFENCFMGRTLAIASITDKAGYRDGLPPTLDVDYIPFYDHLDPEGSIQRSVSVLKKYLNRYPGEYAAMVVELIQGEGGYYPGSHEFFSALMTELKSHGVCIIIDEIQTFGRLDTPFAFQHFKLESFADIVTVGKLSQVCATLFSDEYRPRAGLISQTFTSSSAAIASSIVILESLKEGGVCGENGLNMRHSQYFNGQLKRLESTYPDLIEGPYGYGMMLACTMFKGEPKRVYKFLQEMFNCGLIAFVAGRNPTRVRFLPPVGGLSIEVIDRAIIIIEDQLKKEQKR